MYEQHDHQEMEMQQQVMDQEHAEYAQHQYEEDDGQ